MVYLQTGQGGMEMRSSSIHQAEFRAELPALRGALKAIRQDRQSCPDPIPLMADRLHLPLWLGEALDRLRKAADSLPEELPLPGLSTAA
jgi:hypothetical protein